MMAGREVKFTYILYSFFTLVSVAGAATVLLQSEYSGLLSPVVVFLLPLMLLLLWAFRRMRGITYPETLQRQIRRFRIALVAGWCISLLPGAFWGAIFFYIYEPWPFSLNQGPDTVYAIEGFTKVLGGSEKEEVRQVYYKGYDFRDDDRYLRFNACSKDIEEQVVAGLEKAPDGEKPPSFHLNAKLSWWFTESEAITFEHWKGAFKEVWIDRAACTFYVRHWTT